MVILVAACGSSSKDGAGGKTVTVKMVWNDGYTAAMKRVIADFEKVHPEIKIQASYMTSAHLTQLLTTELPAGNAPDIFDVLPGFSRFSVVGLAKQGQLADLSDAPWAKEVLAPVKPLVSYQGRVYGFMTGVALQGIVYDKAAFAKSNITPPQTFSELLTMCRTLKGQGVKVPLSVGWADNFTANLSAVVVANSVVEAANPDWTTQRLANKTTFAGTPAWHTALQNLITMNKAGCFGPSPQAMGNPQYAADLGNGTAASAILGADAVPGLVLAAKPDFDWGEFAFPGATADATRATWYATGAQVYAHSKVLAAAKTFVNFFATAKEDNIYAKMAGLTPNQAARTGDFTQSPRVKAIGEVFAHGRAAFVNSFNWPAPMQQAFGADLQGLFTGQKSVEATLADADKAWATGGN